MGERVGHDITLAFALQPVVADRAGGVQALFDVAFFQGIALAMRVVGPYAGEAVRLQFHSSRELSRRMVVPHT